MTSTEEETPRPLFALRTHGVSDTHVRDLSRQLLRDEDDEDWGHLLSAAPRTLCSIGYCFAAAWSTSGNNIVQEKDSTINRHLRSNLVDCSDLGREAFREAEIKMHQVSMTIQTITEQDGTIYGILESIQGTLAQVANGATIEPAETSELFGKLHDLEQYANDCTKDSETVVQKFTKWQELATKINSAYTEANEQEKEDLDKIKKEIDELNKALPKYHEHSTDEHGSNTDEHGSNTDEHGSKIESLKRFFKRKKAERAAKREQRLQTDNPKVSEKLQDISAMGATKDGVIKVLEECLHNLTDLKGDLEDLHSFFRTLHQEIENINKTRVPKFIKLAGQPVNETTEPTDKRLEGLRREVLRLSGFYTRAGEKSSTYVTVSRKHIMPGINKVNGLNKLDKDAIDEKVKLIVEYSKAAEKDILELARQRQQERRAHIKSLGQQRG
ncbi:hypothetical protein K440DRAFT_636553 [Wilcoxina mikolae CBS 423.85]|nr:hypothetical protein K440DRAFT_636553 [Wilcoxina mikolae CBS 423.85]